MDWCPVASAPWIPYVNPKRSLPLKKFVNLNETGFFASDIDFWMRTDGIFLFRVEFNNFELEDDAQLTTEFVRRAKLISLEIKRQFRNRSEPNGVYHKEKRNFDTISISPRKIAAENLKDLNSASVDDPSTDQIRDHLKDDRNLLALKAKDIGDELDVQVPAVLLLRRQFAKCFEAAIDAKIAIKEDRFTRVTFANWARILRPFSKETKENISKVETIFKKRGKLFPTAAYFLLLMLFSALTVISRTRFENWTVTVDLWDSLTVFALMASVTVWAYFAILYFVDVILVRRSCMKAFNKAQRLLRSGTIYCTVLQGIVERAERKFDKPDAMDADIGFPISTCGDFEISVQILDDWKSIEIKKKNWWHLVFIPLLFFSLIPILIGIEARWPAAYQVIDYFFNMLGRNLPSAAGSSLAEIYANPFGQ